MRTFFLVGIAAASAAFLSSCGEGVPNADTSTPAATVVAIVKPVATPTPVIGANSFVAPFVVSSNTALIPPTDKARRQEELEKKVGTQASRDKDRDPFAIIPGSVPLPPATTPNPTVTPPSTPRVRVSVPRKQIQPEPLEAQSVRVSGIIEIAGSQFALISVPGETTTRYVRAGQRIANNKVLVKRIETSGTPRVILEQFNIEVPRAVGQVVAVAGAPGAPVPVSAPVATPDSTQQGVILPPAPVVPQTVNPAGVPNVDR